MNNDDNIVFDGVTLSDIFRDIYNNTSTKREHINGFIKSLTPYVRTAEEASIIAPIIKDFLEVSVKNDEQLVRLSQIVQRIISSTKKVEGDDGFLTEDEKMNLLKNVQAELVKIHEESEEVEDTIEELKSKTND